MQSFDDHRSSIQLVLFVCLITILCSQVSSLGDTLSQGDTLNSTSQLVSARRRFTLGFYTPEYTKQTYVSIWYTNQSLSPFPVWIGNRDNPVENNSRVNMAISSNGSLLINGQNRQDPFVLYAGVESRQNLSATLLDSGNFVLRQVAEDGELIMLWQSFDYPTDTLLPGMKLGMNHRTGRSWTLTSWFGVLGSFGRVSSGPFTLEWNFTMKKLVVKRRGTVYWTSGEMMDYYVESANLTIKKFENIITPDLSYNFTNFASNDEEYFMFSVPDNDTGSRWRLDYENGNVTDGMGNSIASVNHCSGYNSGNHTGCELRQQPECRNQQQTFLKRSGYFDFPDGEYHHPYSVRSNLSSLSDCRESCWNDCECVGFDDYAGCEYWRGRDLTFQQNLAGNSPIIYVLEGNSPNNRSRLPIWSIWIIVTVIITALLLLVATALILARRSKRRKREDKMKELLTLEGHTEVYQEEGGAKSHGLRMFTYSSIVAATSNFSEEYKLGEGGFGPVYKGKTTEGHEIAVKLLSRSSGQGLVEFKTELILISKLQHVNLVKLVGFCMHGEDKMIVYDYMPNKSLDFFLFDQSKSAQLDWDTRFNIIQGIAQGLLYLHKYSRLSIVHRDLKCSNILLDENFNPKISDFGLARIFKQETDEANTNRRVGTYGYMAPEYAMQGIFSFKSDVYSFGVLVLEILSGRKNSSFHDIEGPLNLVEHAWELWRKDSISELMDPTLSGTCNVEQLQRCVNIGLLCVENRAADRPNMKRALSMLKAEVTSLPPPRNPAFITRNSVVDEPGKTSTTPEKLSANEVSISSLSGR